MTQPRFSIGDKVACRAYAGKHGEHGEQIPGLTVETVTGYPIHSDVKKHFRILAAKPAIRIEGDESYFEKEN